MKTITWHFFGLGFLSLRVGCLWRAKDGRQNHEEIEKILNSFHLLRSSQIYIKKIYEHKPFVVSEKKAQFILYRGVFSYFFNISIAKVYQSWCTFNNWGILHNVWELPRTGWGKKVFSDSPRISHGWWAENAIANSFLKPKGCDLRWNLLLRLLRPPEFQKEEVLTASFSEHSLRQEGTRSPGFCSGSYQC